MDGIERILRDEPGRYRMTLAAGAGGAFAVTATTEEPVTLTLRVEDAWNMLPAGIRRYRYTARVTDESGRVHTLKEVAPDARIQFDLASRVDFAFEPAEEDDAV